jgi:hypothetical protein
LTGRTQRFAKIEGLRIALDDVEAAFAAAGAVAAVAPQGKIVLFAEDAARQAVTRMIPGLAQSLRLPSTVFVVRSLERLPLRPSGKIDYRALEHAE